MIDALFGSGLSRPLEGVWKQVVERVNGLPNERVSIDLPSGMFADQHTSGPCIHANRSFSFETPKLAYFFKENQHCLGNWSYGSIGLHQGYCATAETPFAYFTADDAAHLARVRGRFDHKGTFGHALLIAGSYGKMGAAVLAARGALRAGVGLLTVHAPRCGNIVLQTTVPEAMYSPDQRGKFWTSLPDLSIYKAIGIGCGIGKEALTAAALKTLLERHDQAMVLDADALNLLSEHPEWWRLIPRNSILTPHVREFERLFGASENDFSRNALLRQKAQEHGVFIVLKGAYTAVAGPDGACSYNSTGNPGMGTGGSGDVLTGILTALLAQGYAPSDAARLGVFLHGLAGDLGAAQFSEPGLRAGDIPLYLGKAWAKVLG
ncbi:MAG: NAD(P)H-hydrate dehydratase [Lewinellaceae bacterium]|nr:NAD(P)H-hydrate dehydratase [Lewinellaceae bacterium]